MLPPFGTGFANKRTYIPVNPIKSNIIPVERISKKLYLVDESTLQFLIVSFPIPFSSNFWETFFVKKTYLKPIYVQYDAKINPTMRCIIFTPLLVFFFSPTA